jgi:hypothetical protein
VSRKKSKDIELLFLKRKEKAKAKFICYSNRIGALKSKKA